MMDFTVLGQRIRELRKRTGMDCNEFARHMGTSRSYLSKTETGFQVPSIAWMERLALGLGVDLGEMFAYLEGPVPDVRSDPFIERIASVLEKLTPYNRRIILEVVQQEAERVAPPTGKQHGRKKAH
jgi:transcriptional regulator with XRE-family HTH domain